MHALFYFSLFFIFYIYIGYPIIVRIIGWVKKRAVAKGPLEPRVTILTAAYNEAGCIEETICNKLALEYPADKFEMIVISDGSDDGTDEIVQKYQNQGVRLIRQEPRAGKTAALNQAVPAAKGEILIFSDANSIYDLQALKKLMQNFADPAVGYVTGKMIYTHPDGSPIGDGCSTYMRYENLLRAWETDIGTVVGVDGGIDAVRKTLYRPMNADQLPDFVLPLMVAEQGFRVVYEPEAILKEPSLKTIQDEYKMRVRVSLRALWALRDMRSLLGFSRTSPLENTPSYPPPFPPSGPLESTPSHPPPFSPSVPLESTPSHPLTFPPSFLFAWQLWSHKALRYLAFIFLLAAWGSNLWLWSENGFYKATFVIQNLGWVLAGLSPWLEKRGIKNRLIYFCHYFALLNIASAHAFFKFVSGQKSVMWTPRKG